MPSKTDLAWTAGMLDADGCISMTRRGGRWRKPYLVVDNTDRSIIDHLVELHGGGVVVKKRYDSNKRDGWSWRLYGGQQIRELLRLLLPYMHCEMKRERARMLVEESPKVTPRNGHYTPELAAAREEFEERFMALGEGRGSRRWRPLSQVP